MPEITVTVKTSVDTEEKPPKGKKSENKIREAEKKSREKIRKLRF